MKKSLVLLLSLLLAHPGWAEENVRFQIEPLFVSPVTETTALGYANGRKLVSDPSGTLYFSAVSKTANNTPGVCVMRTVRTSPQEKPTFEKIWIENINGVLATDSLQFASSLALAPDGALQLVWSGGNQTKANDVNVAHQLRFAKIITAPRMQVAETAQPFVVKGFGDVYTPPFRAWQLWQEYPSAYAGKDGKLHVVWEARDRSRLRSNNAPVPGIAYAVRDPAGQWSVTGEIDKPPYLDVKNPQQGQYRPFMVVDATGIVHVLCYGDVDGRMQILHGRLANGTFSGWEQVAPSRNDQRHVSATMDVTGQIHVAWREGDRAAAKSFIAYSSLPADGKWKPALRVYDSDRYASTPNITTDDHAVYIVWTGWSEGFDNSDSRKNNGFPNDNDTVEGQLEFAYKRFGDDTFSPPSFLTGGIGSYPRIARQFPKSEPSRLAFIWTLGRECLPKDCVQIFFAEAESPH